MGFQFQAGAVPLCSGSGVGNVCFTEPVPTRGLRAVHSELPVRFDPGEQHGLMQRQALMTKADQRVEPRPAQPGHHSEQGRQGLAVLPASKAVARVDLRIMRKEVLSALVVRLRRDEGAVSSPEVPIQPLDGACGQNQVSQGVWLKNAALSPPPRWEMESG